MKQNGRNSRTNLLCSFLVFTAIIGLFCVSFASAANDTEQSGTSTNITPTVTPTPGTTFIAQYSMQSSLLVLGFIFLLAFLFYILFWWSNQLDQTSYLGGVFWETIRDTEWGRIKSTCRDKLAKGEYQQEVKGDMDWLKDNAEPSLDPDIEVLLQDSQYPYYYDNYNPYDPIEQTSMPHIDSSSTTNLYNTPKTELTEEQKKIYQNYKKELVVWERKVKKEAISRYHKDLTSGFEKAKERANDAAAINLGVFRGKGTEFILEFTTVVVIIFAAVILGILQILDTQQIGTLLAAIAGYVLGRATTRTKEGTTTTAPSSTVVDIINAVKGTGGNTPQAAGGGESPQGTGSTIPQGTAGTGQQGTGASGTSGTQGKT